MKLFNTSDITLVKQCQEHSISYCPALHSNVAARNLCISFVALTSSRDQAVVYMYFRLYWHCIAIVFFCFLFHYYFCCIVHVVHKDFQSHTVRDEIKWTRSDRITWSTNSRGSVTWRALRQIVEALASCRRGATENVRPDIARLVSLCEQKLNTILLNSV